MTRHVRVEGLLPNVAPQALRVLEDRNVVTALRSATFALHENIGGEAEWILLQRDSEGIDGVIELRCTRSGVSRGRNHQIKPCGGVDTGRRDGFRRGEKSLRASRLKGITCALQACERRTGT